MTASHYRQLSQTILLNKSGFTLIELLLVLAIIGVLSILIIVAINPAGRIKDTQIKSAKAQLKSLSNEIEFARVANQKVMGAITGSYCTDCGGCRCGDARPGGACFTVSQNNWRKITQKAMPLDPWGNTFTFDENEGEGGSCINYDYLKSPGPDHILGNSGCSANGTDDIWYTVPRFICPN